MTKCKLSNCVNLRILLYYAAFFTPWMPVYQPFIHYWDWYAAGKKLKETKSLSDVEDKLLKLKGRKCYGSFLDERSC